MKGVVRKRIATFIIIYLFTLTDWSFISATINGVKLKLEEVNEEHLRIQRVFNCSKFSSS